jgi:hypothetical protein
MEEWKKIIDFPNYSVSSFGNIRNDKFNRPVAPKTAMRYYRIGLSKNNETFHFSIHRLVAIHFLENPDNLPQVDHINQDKTNNRVDNLRWISSSNNIRNIPKKKGTLSKYTGIIFIRKSKKWQGKIIVNGTCFLTEPCKEEDEAKRKWVQLATEKGVIQFYPTENLSPPLV